MSDAVLALVSAFIGGGLVLVGQWLGYRAEARRHWQDRLHVSVAAVVASFMADRARLSQLREAKAVRPELDALGGVERRSLIATALTVPGCEKVEIHIHALGELSDAVYESFGGPDDAWRASRAAQIAAIADLQNAVRDALA